MSMSLTAHPPEIVGCIVANLASQPISLCNPARCSGQPYLCTVPHLYRHVIIQEEIGEGEQHDGLLKKSRLLINPKTGSCRSRSTFYTARRTRLKDFKTL